MASIALHFGFFYVYLPSSETVKRLEPSFTVALLQTPSVDEAISKKEKDARKPIEHAKISKNIKQKSQKDEKKSEKVIGLEHQSKSIKRTHQETEVNRQKIVKKDKIVEKNKKKSDKQEENQQKISSKPDGQAQQVQTAQEKPNLPATIPQNIQAQMLSYVHYPRTARRRGWQGKAELQLYISAQHIDHIEVAQSTGYSLLDKAAIHGLVSMTMITLKDGMYRLPVVFRLQ